VLVLVGADGVVEEEKVDGARRRRTEQLRDPVREHVPEAEIGGPDEGEREGHGRIQVSPAPCCRNVNAERQSQSPPDAYLPPPAQHVCVQLDGLDGAPELNVQARPEALRQEHRLEVDGERPLARLRLLDGPRVFLLRRRNRTCSKKDECELR